MLSGHSAWSRVCVVRGASRRVCRLTPARGHSAAVAFFKFWHACMADTHLDPARASAPVNSDQLATRIQLERWDVDVCM